MKRNVLRDANNVGLGKPNTVFVDCGCGTNAILLAQSHLYPNAVCIGFEVVPEMHKRGLQIHKAALETGEFKGKMATRQLDALYAGDFRGATNVGLYDGVCCRVDELDPAHILLIAKLMMTDSLEEFTSTKFGSWQLILAYANANPYIAAKLHEFDIFRLTNCHQQKDSFDSLMFVRKVEFRLERADVRLTEDPAGSPNPVNYIICTMLRGDIDLKPHDMYPMAFQKEDQAGAHPVTRKDIDGEEHALFIGLLTVHCVRRVMKFGYGDGMRHEPSGQVVTWVGIKLTPLEHHTGQTVSGFVVLTELGAKTEDGKETELFWIVSPVDLRPLVDGAPSQLPGTRATLKQMESRVVNSVLEDKMDDQCALKSKKRRSKRRNAGDQLTPETLAEDQTQNEPNSRNRSQRRSARSSPEEHSSNNAGDQLTPGAKRHRDNTVEDPMEQEQERRLSSRVRILEVERKAKIEKAKLDILEKQVLDVQERSAKKKRKLDDLRATLDEKTKQIDSNRKTVARREATLQKMEKDSNATSHTRTHSLSLSLSLSLSHTHTRTHAHRS